MRIKGKLLIDQYDTVYRGNSLKDIKDKYGLTGRIYKMYLDDKKHNSVHIGYVIGHNWLTVYNICQS